jgi:TatD DNase family protein
MIFPQPKLEPRMLDFIVDSHCHLDLLEKQGLNIDEIIKNAKNNNVKLLQTICTKISEIEKIVSYTKKYELVYASCGIHPNNVEEELKIKAEEIVKICNQNAKIIGIGETGLDYYYNYTNKENQKKSFIEHIKASIKTNLPLIIHSRDADLEMIDILTREQKNHPFPALLHCFSSSKELARAALDLGIYISISGIVTFKNAIDLQKIVKFLPLDSLLIETDSPYLAPVPYRGKANQPAYSLQVAEFIANLKEIPLMQVVNKTTENFLRIFKKIDLIFINEF